jgi:alpha-D-xyloside xylohydrolase
MKEFHGAFQMGSPRLPDPEAMLKRLKGRGLRICVWIHSLYRATLGVFDEGMSAAICLRSERRWWQWDRGRRAGSVDFH